MAENLENDVFHAYRRGEGYAWHLCKFWAFGHIVITLCGIDLYDPQNRHVSGDMICHNCQRVYLARKAKERS